MTTNYRKLSKKTPKVTHDELYAQIPKLSFVEARRIKWNIYAALTQELYEEGCARSGDLLKMLSRRERELLERNTIGESLSDHHELLIAIYENMKYAERSEAMGECGELGALKLWYQNLLLVERQGTKFDWILKMFYNYLMPQVERLQKDIIIFEETRVRITYKYAMYLAGKGTDVQVAVHKLMEALVLCRGQIWTPDDVEGAPANMTTMHDVVAVGLATVCMQYARVNMATNAEYALQLTHRGIVALAEVGLENNKVLACQAYLTKIEILIYSHKYEAAYKQIRAIYNFVVKDGRSAFIELKCEVYKFMAICCFQLMDIDRALLTMHQSLMMTCKYRLLPRQGDVLLEMGRLYSKLPNERQNAKCALRAAKRIFCDLNDHINEKKADYMLAKQNADHLFPSLLNLMKSHEYCKFFALRQWKNRCTPFWKEDESDYVEFFAEQLWSGDLPPDVLDIFAEPKEESLLLDELSLGDDEYDWKLGGEEENMLLELEDQEGGPKLLEVRTSEIETDSLQRDAKFSLLDTMDITLPPKEADDESDKDSLFCLLNEFLEEDELKRQLKMQDPIEQQLQQEQKKERNTELFD